PPFWDRRFQKSIFHLTPPIRNTIIGDAMRHILIFAFLMTGAACAQLADVSIARGMVALRDGDQAAAIEAFRDALALEPDNAEAKRGLALAQASQQHPTATLAE